MFMLLLQAKTVPLSNDDEHPDEKSEKKAQLGPGEVAIVGVPASGSKVREALAGALSKS